MTEDVKDPQNVSASNEAASDRVSVQIYDQTYHLRGTDPEYIHNLAEFVDLKMRTISGQSKTVDSLRLAVLAAINISDEYHLLKRRYESLADKYQQKANEITSKLDEVLNDTRKVG
jgi:cell division protein ZapA